MTNFRKWGRFPDFMAVLSRFPIAVICVGLMALVFMMGLDFATDREAGLIGGLILAAYLCVDIQLASESASLKLKLPIKILVAAGSIVLGALTVQTAFLVYAAVIAAILALGNFAHFRRPRHDASVWVFTQKLWTGAIFAFIGSIVFFIGVFAITETVRSLFGVRLNDLSEHIIFPIGLAFLAPVYWMGTLPNPRDVTTDAEIELPEISFEARILAFLGTWILAPLVLVYALIILAFILRSAFMLTIPQGEVATLIGPFIGVGTLTWLMLEPKVLREGGFVRFYRRVWFPVMMVASALLLIAIAIRIGDYGFTPERFSILAIGLAGIVTSGWMTFRDRDIRIPTAVSAFAVLTIAFLAKPVSDINQLARLKTAIAAPDSGEAHETVRESAQYLSRADRKAWLVELFPGGPDDTTWPTYLREAGYNLEPDNVQQPLNSRASFALTDPVDLQGTTKLLRTLSVQVDMPRQDGYGVTQCDSVRRDVVLVTEDELCFDNAGATVKVDHKDQIRDLFASYAVSTRRNVYGDIATNPAPVIAFELPDGRAARLVITQLDLNGEDGVLLGGYGSALIFTE